MIEVEKKFIINEANLPKLLDGADFLNQKKFTDTYWDTPNYSLTTTDFWLRSRDGRFELKVPMLGGGKRVVDQYEELESDEQISDKLNLPRGRLEEELRKADYKPLATITTLRKKYKKDDFIVDVDELDFGYNIVEVELMVNDKSEIDDAVNKIISFANSHNLAVGQVRGKIVEYLRRNNTRHYRALIDSGVVKE